MVNRVIKVIKVHSIQLMLLYALK